MHLPHIKTHPILKVAPHVNGYGRYIFCSIVGNFEGMIADSNLTLTIQALKWLKSALAGKRGVIWDAEEINLKVVKCGVAENLLYRLPERPQTNSAKTYGAHDLGLSALLKCIMVVVLEAGVKDYSFTFST